MKQIVAHKKIGRLHGAVLVAALLFALIVLNDLTLNLLASFVGERVAAITFWVIGGLMAWWMLRVYIIQYSYELGADVLRLNRSYGKRERHIEDIYLSRLLFVGDPEEAKKRWPHSKRVRALHARGENPVLAIVYGTSDGTGMALIQADDALREALIRRAKAK